MNTIKVNGRQYVGKEGGLDRVPVGPLADAIEVGVFMGRRCSQDRLDRERRGDQAQASSWSSGSEKSQGWLLPSEDHQLRDRGRNRARNRSCSSGCGRVIVERGTHVITPAIFGKKSGYVPPISRAEGAGIVNVMGMIPSSMTAEQAIALGHRLVEAGLGARIDQPKEYR